MKIQLVYSPAPRVVHEEDITLGDACTVRDALAQSGWLARFPELQARQVHLSIWGRAAAGAAVLREGDRLEICRPLRVDPKVARRERFVGQGARGAGLFAQRRPGSKAGY
jgi:putative ubiquitin-RnfH superfamily antitoxin RatB of RatAB toxin-antitoxin module